MGVDKETARGRNLQWARVLIKTNGDKVPGSFKACDRRTMFFSEFVVGDTSLGSFDGSPC